MPDSALTFTSLIVSSFLALCGRLRLLFSPAVTSRFIIRPARGGEDLKFVAEMMAAYAASLPIDLAYQNFDSELATLPGKYGAPGGELLLVWDTAGVPLGCAALRPILPEGRCELKRLFLKPCARGLGAGKALTQQVIETARANGYRELYLDTLPTMAAAISLYEEAGFQRVSPYYEPTPPGTIFMSLAL